MAEASSPDKVHLVGSIALDTVEEVYRTVGKVLGRRLRRVPDGELGTRRMWISWQYSVLRGNPLLKVDEEMGLHPRLKFPLLCLADGVKPADLRFGELGYAREARASYAEFDEARKRGELPADARFQLCLPTPMAVVYAYCPNPRDVLAIEAAYEAAMLREVESACRWIPVHDLCIQWDVCHEMLIWDGQIRSRYTAVGSSNDEIIARMKRYAAVVPDPVELGFHLCYGDFEAKHFAEPTDSSKMVELANAISQAVDRPIAYIHMPVPISRTDDAFFDPLRDLKLKPGCELYLGVVHAVDGIVGTQKRIATASKYIGGFGIATECGMARGKTPEVVRELLNIHAGASREPQGRADASRQPAPTSR